MGGSSGGGSAKGSKGSAGGGGGSKGGSGGVSSPGWRPHMSGPVNIPPAPPIAPGSPSMGNMGGGGSYVPRIPNIAPTMSQAPVSQGMTQGASRPPMAGPSQIAPQMPQGQNPAQFQVPQGTNPNSIPGGPSTGWRPKSVGTITNEMNDLLKSNSHQNLMKTNDYYSKLYKNIPEAMKYNFLRATKALVGSSSKTTEPSTIEEGLQSPKKFQNLQAGESYIPSAKIPGENSGINSFENRMVLGEVPRPSYSNFKSLDPQLQPKVAAVLRDLEAMGYNPLVRNGSRSQEQANANAAAGTGVRNSYHTRGLAADIVDASAPTPDKYDQAPAKFWEDLNSIAKKHGLTSGYDFQKRDRPHIDMRNNQNYDTTKSYNNMKQVPRVNTSYNLQNPNANLMGNSMANNDLAQIYTDVAPNYGLDPEFLQKVAHLESIENPNAQAKGSTAKGLYQFLDSTWKELVPKLKALGLSTSRLNPMSSVHAAGMYFTQNRSRLEKSLGREVSGHELYMAHNLGVGGARKLLSADPNTPLHKVLPIKTMENNPKYFRGSRTVQDAIDKYKYYVEDL